MKAIIVGLIISLAFAIAFNLYTYQKFAVSSAKDAAYWKQKAFKVDTTYTHTRFILPDPGPKAEPMPPQTVEVFDPPAPETQHVKISLDTAGMVTLIDSITRSRAMINNLYLTQFPKADKIINGQFGHDNINLTLLGTDGIIKTENYPIDLSLYKYQFQNNLMTAEELSASEKKKYTQGKVKFYNGTYVNFQRDFINQTNAIRASSGITLWKVRLRGFAQQSLTPSPEGTRHFQAGASVGLRLF